MIRNKLAALAVALLAATLGACGGGGGDDDVGLGGTVSGLPAGSTVVLADNGANPVTVQQAGAFSFPGGVVEGSAYEVTVMTQPAGATCAVLNGAGQTDALGDDVSNVAVQCAPGTTVGGSVAGLAAGTTVALSDGITTLPVSSSGTFAFTDLYADGAPYAVSVATQPAGQLCSVANGSGAVDAAGDAVSNVTVTCAAGTTVGGTLTGLATGATLTLGDGQSTLALGANGAFAFTDVYAAGAAYTVAITAQPAGEVCTATNGSGTIDANGDSVTSVAIACVGDGMVGGSVTGLATGSTVTLSDGIGTLAVAANGSFVFPDVFAAAAPYGITVATQPGTQTCTVANGAGAIDAGDDPVTTVAVACQ